MKKNTLAWFVVTGATIALSGVGMAACSSSSATGVPGGGDTDASSGGDSSVGKDGSSGSDSGGGGDAGADSSCGSTPTLHTTTDDAGHSDIFCSPATGSPAYCEIEAGANHCCIDTSGTGFPNGQCTTGACTYPAGNGIDIQCLDDKGCGSGEKCCGVGHAYIQSACGYQKVYGFKGTQCAADCAAIDATDAGHFEVCSKTQGCSSGIASDCVATKQYVQFGVCK